MYNNFTEKMDSSAFKRFANSVDNILESLEDVDLTAEGKTEVLHSFPANRYLLECGNEKFFFSFHKQKMMRYLKSCCLESSN